MALPPDSAPGSSTLTELAPSPSASASGLGFYVGQILGERYRIIRLLGQGGMGWVFLARHVVVGKAVAVKILDSARVTEHEGVTRLFREAQAAAAIGHPSIIDVHDVGLTPTGDPYLVMEYLEGEDLSSLMARQGPLSLAAACGVFDPIVSALNAAHSKGIVHRDLKPANIYLVRREDAPPTVKLIDFGISKFVGAADYAKLTVTGAVLGTPAYMSPEQARGEEQVDRRTDLYAIGVMLFQMLTGRRPFEGANYNDLIYKIINEQPQLPKSVLNTLPEEAGALINRAISKDPADRHQSASELLKEIRSLEAWCERADALDELAAQIEDQSSDGWDLEGTAKTTASRSPDDELELLAKGDAQRDQAETRVEGTTDIERPRRQERGTPALLTAGAIAAIAILAFWLNSTTTGGQGAPTSSTASSMPPTAAQPDSVQITIRGAPSGATVFYDGAPVGMNPFRVKAGDAIVPIRVEMPGVQPFIATVVPSKDATVQVTLVAIRSRDETAPPPSSSAALPSDEAPPATGKRPIPNKPPVEMGKSGRDTLYTEKFE